MAVMTLLSRTSSEVAVEVVERQPTPPCHIHLHHPPLLPLLRVVVVLVFHPGNLMLLCVSHIKILYSNNQAIPRQYQGGSRVTYNGHLWVAKWWSQAGPYILFLTSYPD